MGKDLHVEYYIDYSHYKQWEPRAYLSDAELETVQSMYYIDPPTEYSGNDAHNLNLGGVNDFVGTRREFTIVINNIMWEEDPTYSNYTAVGNLSLILGESAECDYIVMYNV